jgi:nucleoid-associated protein YgaU
MGSSRKAAELAKFNGFEVDTPLKVGQEIRVPPAAPAIVLAGQGPLPPRPGTAVASAAPAPAVPASKPSKRSHTVGKGETLFSLAKKYYGDGGKFRELAESNGLDPDEPLKVGTELKLP